MIRTSVRIVASFLLVALPACGKKDGGTPDASGTGVDAPGTGADAPGTGVDAPGTGIDATGSTTDCTAYCNAIQVACTGGRQQYTSAATCIASCMHLPAGTTGASAGNSLGCRATHTQLAQSDPATHCVHAGPSGGATCGTTCEGFCSIAAAVCPTEYPSASCPTACTGVNTTPPYSTAITTGDSIECRFYYATLASTDPATNCVETGQNSAMCQ